MRRMMVVLVALGLGSFARAVEPPPDPLLDALAAEATRAEAVLKAQPDAPLYYLSYRVRDGLNFDAQASYGALDNGDESDDPESGRTRILDVSTRVGSPALDNTHKFRTDQWEFDPSGFGGPPQLLPIENDPGALRLAIWRATDRSYKRAAKALIRVRTNKQVKVAEEDASADFTREPPQTALGPAQSWRLDRKAWLSRLERLSEPFKSHPQILHSAVSLQTGSWTSYFVDTDGARIREPQSYARLMISGSVKADDGMELMLYRDFEAVTADQLPTEAELAAAVSALEANLEALRVAPTVEPYTGPALITNRAAGVFFHEVFGHRMEGHRQKDVDEGHTFTHRVGQPVLPAFMSVEDDPSRQKFGETWLNGYYQFDDEGVPAQKTVLVKDGVLKTFLMERSPIKGFDRSNGHGRAQAGLPVVARQGNLIVSSSAVVPFAELRRRLVEEVKKLGKPYGLIFEDISGGFTETRAGMLPQAFKVLPLLVKRVYADGRPDELVRGVNLIGTPLEAFEKIEATGDDPAVFNGYCGAESGWVPVSAVSPSLLVGQIEVERRAPEQNRPPLLPPPLHPDAPWASVPGQPGKGQ